MAGSSCGVTYLSGTTASSVVFNVPLPTLPMSICTVSRYTSASSQCRIFQSSTVNFLQGHWDAKLAWLSSAPF
jgi:hypothetical protein